ncbi:MAG: shikimate dehydrogenase [Paracoccaceae bacterium]|jgi:shikimate dehydrogenase
MNTAPVVAILGYPIHHSKSPRMHGYWLDQAGVLGYYVPLEIHPDNFEDALKNMPKQGFRGANVTIPHKERALEIADYVSERAKRIGAANTLYFDADGKIHADNTDGYGFITNLKKGAPEWNAKAGPALVLGAGGAARAILDALITEETPKLYLTNRTKERAQALASEFGDTVEVLDWDNKNVVFSEVKTLINTTSLGMNGKGDLGLDFSQLTSAITVTDIVYTPLETDLLKHAKQRGCTCVDGLGMLIYQGIPGFSNWFGVAPKVTDELRELLLS